MEEHFGQLWLIPSPPRRRLPRNPTQQPQDPPKTGFLSWIWRDLVENNSFSATDCFPASCRPFDPPPKQIKVAREGIGPGSISFVEAVKRGLKMADRRAGGSSNLAAGQSKERVRNPPLSLGGSQLRLQQRNKPLPPSPPDPQPRLLALLRYNHPNL